MHLLGPSKLDHASGVSKGEAQAAVVPATLGAGHEDSCARRCKHQDHGEGQQRADARFTIRLAPARHG